MGVLSGQLCRRSREGIVLTVRLTPKSSRDEISGVDLIDGNSVLKARVRAIPGKGEANRALTKLIAKWLRVPPSSVMLRSGSKSRAKSIAVHGDPDELERLVESRLAALAQA
ncbi:MAG: DUF167 family protein [Methyloligellaceae bacterium]